MNYDRWKRLMSSFKLDENQATYHSLIKAYSEKHRFYHTSRHIEACLKHLDKTTNLTENSENIELAIWFHDAVYKTRSKNNELESAQWAVQFLENNGISNKTRVVILDLIMATLHNGELKTEDQKLMVDIDLTILGSSSDVYDLFEEQVRKEYKWVPGFIFRKNRKRILKSFINKEFIFKHKYFFDKFEGQARINLKTWIDKF